jgi:hypothetical protein
MFRFVVTGAGMHSHMFGLSARSSMPCFVPQSSVCVVSMGCQCNVRTNTREYPVATWVATCTHQPVSVTGMSHTQHTLSSAQATRRCLAARSSQERVCQSRSSLAPRQHSATGGMVLQAFLCQAALSVACLNPTFGCLIGGCGCARGRRCAS